MKRTFGKIFNFLMPDHLDYFVESQGERVIDKCSIFISLCLIFLFVALSFGTLHIIHEGYSKKFLTQVFTFTFLLVALIIFKKSKNYHLSILFPFSISLVHLPVKYFQHHLILSPTPIWFMTIPPILFYLGGRKVGVIGYFVYLTEYAVTTYLIKDGAPITTTEWIFIFSVFIASAIFIYFIFVLEKTQKKWDTELKDRVLQESHSAHLISLGEMSGAIAHEINNPLAIIQGNAQSVRKSLRTINSTNEYDDELYKLEKLLNNVSRVTEIVSSLNALTGDSKGEKKPFVGAHFKKSFIQFHSLISERLKKEGIELKYDQKDLSVVIPCRPEVITQCLINLCSNSMYAIKGQENPWIQLKIQTLPNKIRLYFQDSGEGLSKRTAARMFEPFYTTKKQGEGVGIGLSITRNKLLKEKAAIRYDHGNKFTTFVIEFPVND